MSRWLFTSRRSLALIAAVDRGRQSCSGEAEADGDLIAPDLAPQLPHDKAIEANELGGGGGGGDHDKLQAPKGGLPRPRWSRSRLRRWSSAMTIPNFPSSRRWSFLRRSSWRRTCRTWAIRCLRFPPDRLRTEPVAAVASARVTGGGVGSGTGPGVGPGHGGGIGGGVFRVGGGVSPPRALDTPDPEYSEEARKAKYQGTCVLWLIVGPDGKPRDIKVARALGMGLDQKAIEAVRNWKFEPALKDGKPVAVQINVEVNFRLY